MLKQRATQQRAYKREPAAGLTETVKCHTWYGMKMTMHIDDALLERVMKAYGYESKTEAVEMALKEMDRRARLKEFMKNGLGLTAGELADAVDPAYDVLVMRAAEPAGEYGKRRPS